MTRPRRISMPSLLTGLMLGVGVAVVPFAVASGDGAPSTFDATAPTLSVSPVSFVVGASIDAATVADPTRGCSAAPSNFAVPLRTHWSAEDWPSGVPTYQRWVTSPLAGTNARTDTSSTTWQFPGENYAGECSPSSQRMYDKWHWIAVQDHRGNTAASAMVRPRPEVWREDGLTKWGRPGIPVRSHLRWSTESCTACNHGQALVSTVRNASLTYSVTVDLPGRHFAVVATRGPEGARLQVRVDRQRPTVVETKATRAQHRVIVWQRPLTVGTHRVTVRNIDGRGERLAIDAVMLSPAFAAPPPVLPGP